MRGCECNGPGFCARQGIEVDRVEHAICRGELPPDHARGLRTAAAVLARLCANRSATGPQPAFTGAQLVSDRRIGPSGLLPGDTHFNNSILRVGGRRLMAYRLARGTPRIALCELDEQWQPANNQILALAHGVRQEDPRLFVHRGALHVSYTAVEIGERDQRTHVCYARLEQRDGRWIAVDDFAPHYPGRRHWEKNWGFFEHGEQLFAVYSIRPHHVLAIERDRAELAYASPNHAPTEQFGFMRGGAAPARNNGEFYGFFHGLLATIYTLCVYTFESAPPFCPRRACPWPLLYPNPPDRPHKFVRHCVYPCGAFLEDERWYISYGYYDREVRLVEYDARDIEASLEVIAEPSLQNDRCE